MEKKISVFPLTFFRKNMVGSLGKTFFFFTFYLGYIEQRSDINHACPKKANLYLRLDTKN